MSERPRRLGDYELEERLGSGGMGTVYAARHAGTDARYAVKTLATVDAELLQRFQREGIGQARVDEHPNIVKVHTLDRSEGTPYLVMDLIEGGSLEERLRRGRPTPEQAAGWVRALADAVEFVHQRGVLHRDIKPANVLFDGETPKLTDFGLVKLADARSLTETGAILGTPGTMAPEQVDASRGALGPPTDVYGLGALLYWCLTGVAPFSGGTSMATMITVLNDPPRPPRELAPEVPPALEQVVLRCLEKDPACRFSSAAALGEAIEAALADPQAERSPRRAAAAGVVTLALAVAVVVAVSSAGPEPGPAPVAASTSTAPSPTTPAAATTPTPRGTGSYPGLRALTKRLPRARLPHELDLDLARALDGERDPDEAARAAIERYRRMLTHRTNDTPRVARFLGQLLLVDSLSEGLRFLVYAALVGDGRAAGVVGRLLRNPRIDARKDVELGDAALELEKYFQAGQPRDRLQEAAAAHQALWNAFPRSRRLPELEPPTEPDAAWSRPPTSRQRAALKQVQELIRTDQLEAARELIEGTLKTQPSRKHAMLYRLLAGLPLAISQEDRVALLARATLLGDDVASAVLATALGSSVDIARMWRPRLRLREDPELAEHLLVLYRGASASAVRKRLGAPSEEQARAAWKRVWLAFPDAR